MPASLMLLINMDEMSDREGWILCVGKAMTLE